MRITKAPRLSRMPKVNWVKVMVIQSGALCVEQMDWWIMSNPFRANSSSLPTRQSVRLQEDA